MSDKTGIEWTDATWNPIVGCSVVSPGCTHCYAMRGAARMARMGVKHYDGLTLGSKAGPVWNGKLAQAPESLLLKPIRQTRPRRIFVNSMSDLFHESVPDAWIDRVFAVMALCPQHTFQVLTKRAKRMRGYCANPRTPARIYDLVCDWALNMKFGVNVTLISDPSYEAFLPPGPRVRLGVWPLPNVWLGVSAERQEEADARIPELLATPAAVRGVGAEPLLAPIDFLRAPRPGETWDWLTGERESARGKETTAHLDWIIVGGESGPGARPMHPDWVRAIRDQCAAARVRFFFKQWGDYLPNYEHPSVIAADAEVSNFEGRWFAGRGPDKPAIVLDRVGKRSAGRQLDGVEHDEMPESVNGEQSTVNRSAE